MVIVEDGKLIALTDYELVGLMEAWAANRKALASHFGCTVGVIVGDVDADRLSLRPRDPLDAGDPFAELVVLDGYYSYVLSPSQWVAFIGDSALGAASVADYGTSMGPVIYHMSALDQPQAAFMAEATRRAAGMNDLPALAYG